MTAPAKPEPAERVRLVVTDIDGTLVDREKQLSVRAIAAADALRRAGVKLALVSSRPGGGGGGGGGRAARAPPPLASDPPIAGFNGGEIVGPDGRLLERLSIPDPSGRLAVEMLRTNGIDAWVFADDQWFITDPAGPYVPFERKTVQIEPTVVPDFDAVIGRASKIMGATTEYHLLERIETEMMTGLGGAVAAHRSQDYYLDITHPQARKDHALRRLARLLDVPVEETAALGDMPNDNPMLRIAGLSIAMGNAPDDVQETAMFVTNSNDQDGWADAIEQIILPRAPGLN